MELSNKALAVLLLAAMVISLGGTIISLNRMDQVQTVGYATTGIGTVNLTIGTSTSIAMIDNSIEFGTCTPYAGAHANITSENTLNTSICSGFTQDNLSLRNDGNVNATVTINVSKVGAGDNASATQVLLNSTSGVSRLMYKTSNFTESSYTGGCTTGSVSSYTPFTDAVTGMYVGCTNLKAGITANAMATDFLITVPSDVPQGYTIVNVQFNAAISGTP